MRVSFEIPTTPYGKARHRTGLNGMMYKDKVTENFENLVKVMYRKASKHFFEDAIELYFVFNFSIPESYSKKKRNQSLMEKLNILKNPTLIISLNLSWMVLIRPHIKMTVRYIKSVLKSSLQRRIRYRW